eukprot:615077-Pleurochrysis_carterae.AAC.1
MEAAPVMAARALRLPQSPLQAADAQCMSNGGVGGGGDGGHDGGDGGSEGSDGVGVRWKATECMHAASARLMVTCFGVSVQAYGSGNRRDQSCIARDARAYNTGSTEGETVGLSLEGERAMAQTESGRRRSFPSPSPSSQPRA